MQCLEAAFDGACPQRHPGAHRLGDALKVSGAKVLKLEQIAEKTSRRFGNDHCVWLSNPLQTSCEVWCLADDAAFLRFARSSQIADNDQPSGDANTGLQGSRRLKVLWAIVTISPSSMLRRGLERNCATKRVAGSR